MRTHTSTICVWAALCAAWPLLAQAQSIGQQANTGNPGGLQIDLGVSSSLSVDDNFQLSPNSGGTSTILDNTLTFDLSSITPTQDLRLFGSTVLRYADIPGRTMSGFEDPLVRLSYRLQAVDSEFTLSARYRRSDRDFLDPFQVEQEEQLLAGTGLFAGGGTLTVRNASIGYRMGMNAPLGFQITATHDEKSYEDLSILNTRLFDTRTDSVNAVVTARVSPVMVLDFDLGYSEYSADDSVQTERQTLTYGIGAVYDINPVLVLDARLGWTEIDISDTNGNRSRSGATGLLKLTRTLPTGSIFASVDSTVNTTGTRTALRFGRDLQLPRGTLSASLGLTRTPAGNTDWNSAVSYSHNLASSTLSVSLRRDVSTNNLDEEIVDTRLALGYDYQINSISSLNVTLNYGRSESADDLSTVPTVTRTTLRAAYSRNLTRDWAMTAGVQLRDRKDSSATGDARSNAVFMTLGRTFSYRP